MTIYIYIYTRSTKNWAFDLEFGRRSWDEEAEADFVFGFSCVDVIYGGAGDGVCGGGIY